MPGADDGRVEQFEVVGGGERQNIGLMGGRFQATEELFQGPTSAAGTGGTSASGGDGVEMIEQHDHGAVGASEIEDAPHVVAGILTDQFPAGNGHEVAGEFTGGRLRDVGLSAAAGAVQQDPVEGDFEVERLAGKGQEGADGFGYSGFDFVHATNIGEGGAVPGREDVQIDVAACYGSLSFGTFAMHSRASSWTSRQYRPGPVKRARTGRASGRADGRGGYYRSEGTAVATAGSPAPDFHHNGWGSRRAAKSSRPGELPRVGWFGAAGGLMFSGDQYRSVNLAGNLAASTGPGQEPRLSLRVSPALTRAGASKATSPRPVRANRESSTEPLRTSSSTAVEPFGDD